MTRRVAILCEFGTLNGGERSLLSVLPALPAAGWQPIVLCPSTGALAATLRQRGVGVEPWDCRDGAGILRPRDVLRRELGDQLQRLAPALVHANSLSMGRLSGPVVASAGLPSIAHLRDIVSLSRAAVADLNQHSRLLAVSEATRAAHIAQGISVEKTSVLYNGVDLTEVYPAPHDGWLHREFGLPTDALLIGCIGQIILRKGQDVLAAAASRLAERWPNLHYGFIGARHSEKAETRQFEADLRAAFATGSLAGHAHFLGIRDDVPRVLRELTLLVHPARQEPLGRVLLEAAASGCAIVATDVGGTREIFPSESESAVLVPPGDPEQLAVAIEQLLHNPAQRTELGRRAARHIAAEFAARVSAEKLIEHYNEVAECR